MLRRSFLGLLGAAIVAPLVSPLEAFAPAAVPVLAVETTVPYWLLELQAYERHMAWWTSRVYGEPRITRREIPKLPLRPLEVKP